MCPPDAVRSVSGVQLTGLQRRHRPPLWLPVRLLQAPLPCFPEQAFRGAESSFRTPEPTPTEPR